MGWHCCHRYTHPAAATTIHYRSCKWSGTRSPSTSVHQYQNNRYLCPISATAAHHMSAHQCQEQLLQQKVATSTPYTKHSSSRSSSTVPWNAVAAAASHACESLHGMKSAQHTVVIATRLACVCMAATHSTAASCSCSTTSHHSHNSRGMLQLC